MMSRPIPISQIVGYENAKPKRALVKSIQDQGFLVEFPVILTPEDDGNYRLLDGRRRTAAAKAAGLESVLAEISEAGVALTILSHATRSENPVAELKAYQELQRQGLSQEEIARMAPEVQRKLAHAHRGEKITGPLVHEYRQVEREKAVLSVDGLEELFAEPEAATIEDVFTCLSEDTLYAILAEMPEDNRFIIWRGKVRQALQVRTAGSVAIQFSQPVEVVSV